MTCANGTWIICQKKWDNWDLDCLFSHADEAVYSKLMMIKWLNEGLYDKLFGGFHTLLVKLKILHKKYGLLGMKDWWLDSNVADVGCADKAAEGEHYCRSTQIHKQSFEALVHFRIMKILENLILDDTFTALIGKLRVDPSPALAESVIAYPNFCNIRSAITATSETLSSMFVNYIKGVSALLAIIRSVRECNIEMHLEAERAFLPQLFVFVHPNYSRYLTYQHTLLEVHRISNTSIWKGLKENGFGGSLTGDKFSTKRGDPITETTVNREVKVRGGPMQGGYSTDLDAMNVFKKNSHLLAKLRSVLKERVHLLISSNYKETTLGARKKHENMIKRLVTKLG